MSALAPLPDLPLTDHAAALVHLSRDSLLAQVIAQVGDLPVLAPTSDPFGTLIRSVNGQQLSVKAAASIHGRLVAALGQAALGEPDAETGVPATVTPEALLAAEGETLRSFGLSWAKVRTVQALAAAALDGRVDFAHLSTLPDEAVISALIPLPGIGRWTVEMFLMFALARPDVFSMGDLALRQGLTRLHPQTPPAEVLESWAPYRTLAARYVWAENHRVKGGGEPVAG
ncbi:DNA-3-methyladenine glycosylase 2 family protein [Deinococcus sp. Arct2-2]|uniref:DNA-3-methyladenine glycosylase family protein n=1 Tax=Deinococcus sp. Arct2-2 TaxID=2568653 RepID=UPI0010A352F6|nr:DNA-3-methyladenine glycosylase [Deinococcus sp. Arct2-2]THF69064.1 DNA-3-methyladenine glycosylase 2 family protein [Deinococcus sp. Arct2-2]